MFNNNRIASLLCCLVLGACGGQTAADTGATSSFDAQADADRDTAGSAMEGGAGAAETPTNEATCQRDPSPPGDFATQVTLEKVTALGDELRSAVGPSFTGITWRSSTSVEVYGTATEATVELSDLAERHGIEVVYWQVPATSADLDEASDWLAQHIRSTTVDVRVAYVDVTCGAVVVIVGDDASHAALQKLAAEAGRLPHLAIVVDPSYATFLREPAPPAGQSNSSRCPLIRGIGLDAGEYLHLVEDQAEAQASEAGFTLLVECRDGEIIPPPRPTNIDHSRLWISIDDGVVSSAYRV